MKFKDIWTFKNKSLYTIYIVFCSLFWIITFNIDPTFGALRCLALALSFLLLQGVNLLEIDCNKAYDRKQRWSKKVLGLSIKELDELLESYRFTKIELIKKALARLGPPEDFE